MLGPGGKMILGGAGAIIALVLLWIFVISPVFLTRSNSASADGQPTNSTSAQGDNNNNNSNASPSKSGAATTLTGQIVDAVDGSAVTNAVVTVGQTKLATTDSSGSFSTSTNLPSGQIIITAPGYQPLTLKSKDDATKPIQLSPLSVSGTLVDSDTKQPLGGMPITSGNHTTNTDKDGKFVLAHVQDGDPLEVKIFGYAPLSQKIDLKNSTNLTLAVQSSQFQGSITDSQSGKPVPNALLTMGNQTAHSTGAGTFYFSDASDDTANIKVRAPGYKIRILSWLMSEKVLS